MSSRPAYLPAALPSVRQRSSLSSNSSREQIAVLRPTTAFYSRDGANLMSSDNFQKTPSLIINELLFYYSRDDLHETNPKASGAALGLNCAASFEQPAGGDAPVGAEPSRGARPQHSLRSWFPLLRCRGWHGLGPHRSTADTLPDSLPKTNKPSHPLSPRKK